VGGRIIDNCCSIIIIIITLYGLTEITSAKDFKPFFKSIENNKGKIVKFVLWDKNEEEKI